MLLLLFLVVLVVVVFVPLPSVLREAFEDVADVASRFFGTDNEDMLDVVADEAFGLASIDIEEREPFEPFVAESLNGLGLETVCCIVLFSGLVGALFSGTVVRLGEVESNDEVDPVASLVDRLEGDFRARSIAKAACFTASAFFVPMELSLFLFDRLDRLRLELRGGSDF